MNDDTIWIDSHAHLSMFEKEEMSAVLERAEDRGVGGVLTPATGRDDLETSIALAEEWPGKVVAAAGVHPHEADSLGASLKRKIEQGCTHPGVVAVGEIGLDYHYLNSPREDQLAAFAWQLDLAIERDLPVVVHNRESWSDLESVLGEAALEPNRVLVETDSPFLAPVPHRGHRNEPSFVPLVGVRLAEEWKKPVEEIASLSSAGFRDLFDVADDWPS